MNITLRKKATNSVVADYLFDKGSGSVLYDQSGNEHNGELKNSPTWVDGKFGGALDFNGTTQYVEIPDSDDFSFEDDVAYVNPFSISAWIYMDDIVNFPIVSKYTISPEYLFGAISGKVGLSFRNGPRFISRLYDTPLSIGQWYHVVATYDGRGGVDADDGMKIYIDAVRKDDATSTFVYPSMVAGADPVWIGRESSNYANGKIDEVIIFNKELTQAEVSALYIQNKAEHIVADSLVKEDIINEQKDTLRFRIEKYGDVGFTPAINDEYELFVDATKEFAGVVLEVNKSIQAGQMVVYDVVCIDYSLYANRELVLERYDDETVDLIISDIIGTYASDFATTSISCSIEIATVVFNRMTVTMHYNT